MATAIAIVQTMIDMALTAQERAEFQQEVLNLGRLIIKLQGRFEAYEVSILLYCVSFSIVMFHAYYG